MKCETCKHWKVLNQHHIVAGQPVKTCDIGEHPDLCKEGVMNFAQPPGPSGVHLIIQDAQGSRGEMNKEESDELAYDRAT